MTGSGSSAVLDDDELDLELVELDRSLLDAVPLLTLLSRAAARADAGLATGPTGPDGGNDDVLAAASSSLPRASLSAASSTGAAASQRSDPSWSVAAPTAGISFPGVARASVGAAASTSSGFPGFRPSSTVAAGTSVVGAGGPGVASSGSSSTLSSSSWGSGESSTIGPASSHTDGVGSPSASTSGLRSDGAARSWPGLYAGMDAGSTTRADLVIVFVARDERPLGGLAGLVDWRSAGRLSAVLRSHFFEGEVGEQLLIPLRANIAASRLVAIGLGMPGSGGSASGKTADPIEQGRAAGEAAAVCALRLRACTVLVGLPARLSHRLTAEGILLGWAESMRAVRRGDDVLARVEQMRLGAPSSVGDASQVGTEDGPSVAGEHDPASRDRSSASEASLAAAVPPRDAAAAGGQGGVPVLDASAAKESQVSVKKGKKRGKEAAGKSRSKGKLRGSLAANDETAAASGTDLAKDRAPIPHGAEASAGRSSAAETGPAATPSAAAEAEARAGSSATAMGGADLVAEHADPHANPPHPGPTLERSEDPASSGAFIAERLRTGPHTAFDRGDDPPAASGDSWTGASLASMSMAGDSDALASNELDSGPHLGPPEPPLAVFACDAAQIARLRRVLAGPPRAAGV